MQVIEVPKRLRMVAGLMLFSAVFAAIETILVLRAPWWRLPYKNILISSLSALVLAGALAYFITRAKRWAFSFTVVVASLWVLFSGWYAATTHHPMLGFFALGLLFYWVWLVVWLGYELRRTYFDPQLKWFQGLPEPIPGLICDLGAGERKIRLKTARIDQNGAFIFSEQQEGLATSYLKRGNRSVLTFVFRERQVQCLAKAVATLPKNRGAGFLFTEMSPDERKKLGDFVEQLRGEGHVE